MNQLAVQKAAHLLHVSPGRGPTQPIAGADLLQQHVDTGGLRSPLPDPDAVSTGETTDAGRIRPPAAHPACAKAPGRASQSGALERPPTSWPAPPLCQPAGRKGLAAGLNPLRPTRPNPAPAPWGPGLPGTHPPSSSTGGVFSEPALQTQQQNTPPGGGDSVLEAPPANAADLFPYELATL